jgi:hypothetical protein
MVFGSAALEVGIALFFVYFIGAVIVSGIREIIASILDTRAKVLRKGIEELINDESFRKKVLDNPIIKSLETKSPFWLFWQKSDFSYLASNTFVQALLKEAFNGTLPKTLTDIRTDLNAIVPTNLREVLIGFADFAIATTNDTEKQVKLFITSIEAWYDEKMERLRGLYKKNSLFYIVVTSLAIVAFLNIDTLNIVQTLSENQALRETLVEQISRNTDLANVTDSLDKAKEELAKIAPVIGYPNGFDLKIFLDLSKIVGWILSVAALSLGAPFWFDLLNKLVNLRLAGRAAPTAT